MRISDWSSDVCSPDLSCAIVNVVARPRLPDVVTQFRQALLQVSNLGMQAWRGERAGQQMQPRPRVGLLRQCDQCARGFAPGRYFAVLQHGLRAIRIPDVEHRCLCENIGAAETRSEEHTSELQSLIRNSYAVFCLK